MSVAAENAKVVTNPIEITPGIIFLLVIFVFWSVQIAEVDYDSVNGSHDDSAISNF
jgi:hypothetical protein